MISIPFARNDIYLSFLVILHIFSAMQGICSPAASNIPTPKLTAVFLFPIKNNKITNPFNTHTKKIVIFFKLCFSSSSSGLFSWSIGLNIIRFTDAIPAATRTIQSCVTCVANRMHRDNYNFRLILNQNQLKSVFSYAFFVFNSSIWYDIYNLTLVSDIKKWR